MAETFEKKWLLRALITNVCEERNLPDLKYNDEFLGDYLRLFRKLKERKADLPSVKYITEKYDFSAVHSDMTTADILEELNNFYIKESTTQIIQKLIKESKGEISAISMLDEVAKGFSVVRQAVTKAFTIDISKDVEKVVSEYIRIGEEGFTIPTGLHKLDEHVQLRTGNLVGICGGTGGGKTITMAKMQASLIEAGISSMYFSLEMGLVEMTNRLLAALKKFTFKDLYYNKIDPEEYKKALAEVAAKVQTHIVTRQSEGKIDLQTIERYIVEHKPKVVFIDYLTLIDNDTSWNAEESVTKTLKRIALQNNCLVIFACQADTDAVKSGDIPTLTSVRGNKSFPYDCDIFIGLASFRLEADEDAMKIHYAVRKSRNGGFPEFSMRVKPNIGFWEDCTGQNF